MYAPPHKEHVWAEDDCNYQQYLEWQAYQNMNPYASYFGNLGHSRGATVADDDNARNTPSDFTSSPLSPFDTFEHHYHSIAANPATTTSASMPSSLSPSMSLSGGALSSSESLCASSLNSSYSSSRSGPYSDYSEYEYEYEHEFDYDGDYDYYGPSSSSSRPTPPSGPSGPACSGFGVSETELIEPGTEAEIMDELSISKTCTAHTYPAPFVALSSTSDPPQLCSPYSPHLACPAFSPLVSVSGSGSGAANLTQQQQQQQQQHQEHQFQKTHLVRAHGVDHYRHNYDMHDIAIPGQQCQWHSGPPSLSLDIPQVPTSATTTAATAYSNSAVLVQDHPRVSYLSQFQSSTDSSRPYHNIRDYSQLPTSSTSTSSLPLLCLPLSTGTSTSNQATTSTSTAATTTTTTLAPTLSSSTIAPSQTQLVFKPSLPVSSSLAAPAGALATRSAYTGLASMPMPPTLETPAEIGTGTGSPSQFSPKGVVEILAPRPTRPSRTLAPNAIRNLLNAASSANADRVRSRGWYGSRRCHDQIERGYSSYGYDYGLGEGEMGEDLTMDVDVDDGLMGVEYFPGL
ncbi:hypothetical protein K435DRAFT_849026 [Dendrothele bispora CBS 962.96]|uniref:Uncharacterized protein n=1 Tax=Dendrothele bispora (strain CBS 962.96) TaxID=1314807 RepID=A0A4S8MUC1_DENBC|nr:hypothetical protein K435DRAFT_849026 [Dendrothele bispora CBS 962.96]